MKSDSFVKTKLNLDFKIEGDFFLLLLGLIFKWIQFKNNVDLFCTNWIGSHFYNKRDFNIILNWSSFPRWDLRGFTLAFFYREVKKWVSESDRFLVLWFSWNLYILNIVYIPITLYEAKCADKSLMGFKFCKLLGTRPHENQNPNM